MLLLSVWRRLMIKRQTVAACNGRFRKRRSSAIRTLVAETLVLAKTHGYVEKIENKLEEELARDTSDPPEDPIRRWRRQGDKICKSKQMLLTVVILCIVDCALVLGELALDLYKVKATLEDTDKITKATHAFIYEIKSEHPSQKSKTTYEIFTMLLQSVIIWTGSDNNTTVAEKVLCSNASHGNVTGYPAFLANPIDRNISIPTTFDTGTVFDLDIVGKIAHIFHYCSIAILGVIMIETILKAVCAGRSFFVRKIEVFDGFVVVMSFIVDFCFLFILPDIDTKDFVFILAILLPWRVIRVVNSLVVSVKDHEHFRLKLVYKRKKKITGNLRDTEAMLQKYMSQVTTLQRLCIMEGIEEWKIDNFLKNDGIPHTPMKKKFKFKFDDSIFHMQGHNRAPRCSMPSLDFHGLKLPANGNVSRSRISLPSVANTIKQTISRNLPSRRASLATSIEMYNTKASTNGDIRRKKHTSEELSTMHEEEISIKTNDDDEDEDDDNHDSALSSRATSESGDVFSRVSVSDSISSVGGFAQTKHKSRNNSENDDSDRDDRAKLRKIQEEAKRRHSESTLDRNRVVHFQMPTFIDRVNYTLKYGKTHTKPTFKCNAKDKQHATSDNVVFGLASDMGDDFPDIDAETDTETTKHNDNGDSRIHHESKSPIIKSNNESKTEKENNNETTDSGIEMTKGNPKADTRIIIDMEEDELQAERNASEKTLKYTKDIV